MYTYSSLHVRAELNIDCCWLAWEIYQDLVFVLNPLSAETFYPSRWHIQFVQDKSGQVGQVDSQIRVCVIFSRRYGCLRWTQRYVNIIFPNPIKKLEVLHYVIGSIVTSEFIKDALWNKVTLITATTKKALILREIGVYLQEEVLTFKLIRKKTKARQVRQAIFDYGTKVRWRKYVGM